MNAKKSNNVISIIAVNNIFMCSQILSLTGKKMLNNVFGNQEYIKWVKKHRTKIKKISIIFIFFNVIKSPSLFNNMCKKVKKNQNFAEKKGFFNFLSYINI